MKKTVVVILLAVLALLFVSLLLIGRDRLFALFEAGSPNRGETHATAAPRKRPSTLFKAVFRRDQQVVSELLVKGASPNEKVGIPFIFKEDWGKGVVVEVDVNGWTPLHMAVYQRQEGIIKALLSAGADVDAMNSDGRTPISVVFMTGFGHGGCLSYQDTIRLMIAAGANLNLVDKSGHTALDYAIENGWKDEEQTLTEAGAIPGKAEEK